MRIDLNDLYEGDHTDEVVIVEGGRVTLSFEHIEPCPHCGCEWYLDVGNPIGSSYLCGWNEDKYPCPHSEEG